METIVEGTLTPCFKAARGSRVHKTHKHELGWAAIIERPYAVLADANPSPNLTSSDRRTRKWTFSIPAMYFSGAPWSA